MFLVLPVGLSGGLLGCGRQRQRSAATGRRLRLRGRRRLHRDPTGLPHVDRSGDVEANCSSSVTFVDGTLNVKPDKHEGKHESKHSRW
jgi:hypothetical protein